MPFINLYRSGWFHHQGKPNTFDAHPGDLYASYEAAVKDVPDEVAHLYIGTYPVLIDGFVERHPHIDGVFVKLNGPDSVTRPLAATRAEHRLAAMAVPKTEVLHDGEGFATPLDTSDHEAVHVDPPNVVAYRAAQTAAEYKPAHGGYPG